MCLLRNKAQMMSKCDENKKVAYKGHLKVSVMLLLQLKQTHSNMKSTFFKIIKQKKMLMMRSSIDIPKQCLSLLTVKSPKDIILLTHIFFPVALFHLLTKKQKKKSTMTSNQPGNGSRNTSNDFLKIHQIAKMLTLQKVSTVNDETLQLSAYLYINIYIYI